MCQLFILKCKENEFLIVCKYRNINVSSKNVSYLFNILHCITPHCHVYLSSIICLPYRAKNNSNEKALRFSAPSGFLRIYLPSGIASRNKPMKGVKGYARASMRRMETQNYKIREPFGNMLTAVMKAREVTQAQMSRLCSISASKLCRLCKNETSKGNFYTPSVREIMAISLVLKLTREETSELFFAAFPEVEYWGAFLDSHVDIFDANSILYDAGLSTLGSLKDE